MTAAVKEIGWLVGATENPLHRQCPKTWADETKTSDGKKATLFYKPWNANTDHREYPVRMQIGKQWWKLHGRSACNPYTLYLDSEEYQYMMLVPEDGNKSGRLYRVYANQEVILTPGDAIHEVAGDSVKHRFDKAGNRSIVED